MKKIVRIGAIATGLAVVSIVVVATAAFAQGPTNPPVAPGWMGRGGMGGPQNSLVAVAAKTLNYNVTDLIAELQKGKTLAEVAKAKGVSTDKIVADFVAARTAALKTAVDSKWMTQAQADAMIAYMKSHVAEQLNEKWTDHVFGPGMTGANGTCPFCGTNQQTPAFGPRWRR